MESKLAVRIKNFFVYYFTLRDQLLPQEQAEGDIREGVSFKGMNIIILVLAILIASLGLNTNSTAVIIGAMLISPLMGPIIGVGLGVGIHDFELIKRGLRNLAMAAGFSVLASTLYFSISPVAEGHSELLARTSPTIYDVLIGFVGGAAGILAIGSRSKGNVIPGVAIATALMPPLCTAGYGLATWQLNYFFGAGYLFLINSIYIAFATYIGVKLMKYHAVATVDSERSKKVMRIVYAVALLTMLPSVYLTYNMLRQNKFDMNCERFISQECRFADTQVLSATPNFDGKDGRTLDITLIGRALPTDSLQMALSSKLAFYNLEGTRLRVIQGSQSSGADNTTGSIRDIYQMAQATISRQQQTIDSLRAAARESSAAAGAATALVPELKVLFPQVKEISFTTSVFADVATGKSDTIDVALVNINPAMNAGSRKKFIEYLEARLKVKRIAIVDVNTSLFTHHQSETTHPQP